jgi:hypothetical protein
MINFPRHVDFGAGVATTLAICAIIVHRIVSTEDPPTLGHRIGNAMKIMGLKSR